MENTNNPKLPIMCDPVSYDNGKRYWQRQGQYMWIEWPFNLPFMLPDGFYIDKNLMPQDPYCAGFTLTVNGVPNRRRVKVPILGWSPTPPDLTSNEVVYFVSEFKDSHHGFAENSRTYTIPAPGTYVYQLEGMPPAKSKFDAGDIIKLPLNFLFKI